MLTFRIGVIFLLLQTVIYIVHGVNCPAPSNVNPCACHDYDEVSDVALSCSSEETTLEQIKYALTALKNQNSISVELENLNLGVVPSNFFQGFNVKTLDVTHCTLDDLFGGGEKPLEGLENILEELVISSSFTEENVNAKLIVSHLKNLREIDLSFNVITKLGNDWFKDAPSSLRRLTISNNAIENIGDRAFADVINLEYLALDGNRFGDLSRSMLPNPANELDTLEFDNNALRSLPDDIFTNMPYLKEISLANNGLLHISQNVWRSVWSKLDDIDLRGNPLECGLQMAWLSEIPTCADVSGECASPRESVGKKVPIVHDKSCDYRSNNVK